MDGPDPLTERLSGDPEFICSQVNCGVALTERERGEERGVKSFGKAAFWLTFNQEIGTMYYLLVGYRDSLLR